MGAVFGAALHRGGADLVFFDRRPEVVEAINRDGLRLSGVLGTAALPLPASADPTKLGAVDLALVLVDAGATSAVAEIADGCLKPDGFALTLQNGIGNWEALARSSGHTASWPARLTTVAQPSRGPKRSHQSRANLDRRTGRGDLRSR
jgi:2-dehydropantoate 2-reductase